MGRFSHNGTPSDVVSAHPATVAQQWRRHELDRARRSARLLAEADAWLARYPEFVTTDGSPCFIAIHALLHLRSRYGEGKVTREMVRRAWLSNLSARKDMDWYVAEFLPQLKNTEGNDGE